MSEMSPNGTPKSSRKNGEWQPALSLHVLPDQVHPTSQTLGLPGRSALESDPDVRGWDEPAPHRSSSRCSPSHRLLMGPSSSRPVARPAGACPGQRSRAGRVVQFYRREKNQIFVITLVDRLTRCYLGCRVVWQRTQESFQELVDEAPKAKRYYSDAFDAYDHLWYHGAAMQSPKGKPTPTRLKRITPNCAIIWLAWRAARVVFRAARKPCKRP